MGPSIRALLLSAAAGLSTLLGTLVIFLTKHKSEKLLSMSLGFAAGIMISVSFTDLMPNANLFLETANGSIGLLLTSVFLLLGILSSSLLDRFVPNKPFDSAQDQQSLYRVGFVSMLAIALHNFPEGIATFMAGYENAALGLSIAFAIAVHNIPEGISVAMPIYYATHDRTKAVKYTFLSGISEPIGALAAFLILRPFLSDLMIGAVFAFVAGIMIYIALEELLPASRQYGYHKHALWAMFAGICLMPLTNLS